VKTYRSAREVLGAVEQALKPRPRLIPRGHLPLRQIRGAPFPASPLQQAANLLHCDRDYLAVTIYLEAGGRVWRVASSPANAGCDSMRLGEGNVGQAAKTGVWKLVPDVGRDPQYVKIFPETRSELVMPIKIGAHVIGVIDAESDRQGGFAYEDRVLLERTATALAKFFTGHGKYLVMKAREAAAASSETSARQRPTAPLPTRAEVVPARVEERLRAAAGEKARS
jgi:putative methionine-R-sulfoxide reductase with GAF domain